MMEEKRFNPHELAFLEPIDEEVRNMLDQDNFYVATAYTVTNIPCIDGNLDEFVCNYDPTKDADMVADEKDNVAKVADQIRKKFKVNGDEGWELSFESVLDPFGSDVDNVEVCLLVKPDHWEEVKRLVDDYNAKTIVNGIGGLSLEDGNKAVRGEFSLKPKKGGLFARRRIKKQNEEYKEEFRNLIDNLIAHLRHV